MEATIAATECTERAEVALKRLEVSLDRFKDRIKNDVASMKAGSQRVQSEVSQMDAKYRAAMDLLNSAEFEHAIANAERLARALEAIGKLTETKVSFAVFGGTAK